MESILLSKLSSLPQLSHNTDKGYPCKICGRRSIFFDVVDFNKCCAKNIYGFGPAGITVDYFKCPNCDLIFTTFFDSWTNEDFSRFIYNNDYPLVDPEYDGTRSAQLAGPLADLLAGCETALILDYGSGGGHLAAEFKARGFEKVSNYDPFTHPCRPDHKFDIIICVEIIEHSIDPIATMQEIKEFMVDDGGIVFTQLVQPPDIDTLRANWWYIGPRNGHASIFSLGSLAVLADRIGLIFHSGAFHGFATERASPMIRNAMARVGPEVGRSLRLFAPPADCEGWNGVEVVSPNIRFRWTSASEVVWPPQRCRPGGVVINIPFHNEIIPNFAARCRLFTGDTEWPIDVRPGELIARIDCRSSTTERIRLITPEPLCPYALRGVPDHRVLGLAIPTE
jgi:2-polyprenyl-6-hydroxyphenyl methylase/3-demethylubiquinone-9 3-methyltransferase